MSRSMLREHIFILIFMSEFNSTEEMPNETRLYFENMEKPADDEDRAYIEQKSAKILEKKSEIDNLIDEKADKWKTDRMGKVELAVLRLSFYEILFDEDIPVKVAINEAVELAKKFGQDGAGSFVNAILAKVADE
ncbi:MAG: transcription antitermination factor NusB [Lachnospiraceae bacterium]|nr:transcription antitermination factor NusB [Lachnospiraceae bacterium]